MKRHEATRKITRGSVVEPLMKLIAVVGIVMSAIVAIAGDELLDLSCTVNGECGQLYGSNATCSQGRCLCIDAVGNTTKCKPKNEKVNNIVGGPCPCVQSTWECDAEQDTCYCADKYTASRDRRRCLPQNVPLGAPCEHDLQCETSDSHARCLSRLCSCSTGFIPISGECVPVVAEGKAKCSSDPTCLEISANAECDTKLQICVCSKGFTIDVNGGQCLPLAAYQEPCIENIQCQKKLGSGAICSLENTCRCGCKHFALEVIGTDNSSLKIICKPLPVLGQYCRTSADCNVPILTVEEQTMVCLRGECVNKDDRVSMSNGIDFGRSAATTSTTGYRRSLLGAASDVYIMLLPLAVRAANELHHRLFN